MNTIESDMVKSGAMALAMALCDSGAGDTTYFVLLGMNLVAQHA